MAKFAVNYVPNNADLEAVETVADAAAADAATAIANAATADAKAVTADGKAVTADGKAVTADGKAVAAAAALLAGAGYPLLLAPTSKITGTGSEMATVVDMPSALTPTDGRKVRINGIITVRVRNSGGDAGERILALKIKDLMIVRTAGAWVADVTPDVTFFNNCSDASPAGTVAVALSTFYASQPAHLPLFGPSSGNLAILHTPVSSSEIGLEFDGTIADAGIDTAA